MIGEMTKYVWLLCLAACGPKPTTAEPSATSFLDLPFDQLDHDQRAEFMKQRVMPAMRPLFLQHDPVKFANFGCQTCHGEGWKEGAFGMPNDRLPKLGNDVTKKFKRADIDFMLTEVKPTMARLLKEKEWSPSDPSGFDCFACHTHDR